MLLPLFEQLLQQALTCCTSSGVSAPSLAHCTRPLYPAPLQRNFLHPAARHRARAIAIDNKLRPGIKLFITLQMLRTNIPEPGIASSVLTMVVSGNDRAVTSLI